MAATNVSRRPAERDWLADAMGLSLIYLPWLGVSKALLKKSGDIPVLTFCLFLLMSSLLIYGIYSLWTENRFISIDTNFNQHTNQRIALKSIDELGWNIKYDHKGVIHADILMWRAVVQQAIILVEDKRISINVKHRGTSKGRLPFFFGLNTVKTKQFYSKIKKVNLLK